MSEEISERTDKVNDIKIFENAEFGSVRTIEENGKILFCGSDVAKALGYANTRDAINRHCRGVVKRDGVSETTNQYGAVTQQTVAMSYITEGDIYRLICNSKLPSAEKFEHWVFDDVLPSIRKHGAYMTDSALERALTDPDFLIQLATELKTEREQRKALELKAEQDKPKVLFADAVATSKTSILVGELAKLLNQNGIDVGQNRLFIWLRDNGYLISRKGTDFNMPTQRSMELGIFEIKESTSVNADGSIRTNKTPKVTGKGQEYFVNKFLGNLS